MPLNALPRTGAATLMPLLSALLIAPCSPAFADGMVPQTSVVVINEDEGETSINVLNSDKTKALLHTTVLDVPEDADAPAVIATPPLAHVGAGETQQIRVMLAGDTALKHQHLRRITFEGIPPADTSGKARLAITFRQNIPIIIHPRGLARNAAPWKSLTWTLHGTTLTLTNPSPYVVRLGAQITLLPSGTPLELPRTYILPGETIDASTPASAPASPTAGAETTVRISPATVYGYSVDTYDAPLQRR